jgi:hypothetical protein
LGRTDRSGVRRNCHGEHVVSKRWANLPAVAQRHSAATLRWIPTKATDP